MKNIKITFLTIISVLILATGCSQPQPKPKQNQVEYDYVSKNDMTEQYNMVGIASYYGKRWNGRTTANGEKLNIHAMTAAHKTLPFNTIVKVTLLSTGKSVNVRINDRGPYSGARIIDLTDEAAKRLGMYHQGIGKVRLDIVKYPNR